MKLQVWRVFVAVHPLFTATPRLSRLDPEPRGYGGIFRPVYSVWWLWFEIAFIGFGVTRP